MMTGLIDHLMDDAEIADLFSEQMQIAAMCRAEAALCRAQAQLGMLDQAVADHIETAITQFKPDFAGLKQGMQRDGVVVPELVKQLKTWLGKDDAPFLHQGATSQDIIDTGLMLQLAQLVDIIETRLKAILKSLDKLDGLYGSMPFMAHTRMQRAIETSVSAKLAMWCHPLQDLVQRCQVIKAHGLPVQLGGPVGDGASFQGQGERLVAAFAGILGLNNSAIWQTARAPITDFGYFLALVSGTLGKIGQDIVLLAQNEIAQIKLSQGGRSSAMKHKNNPVKAEILVSFARFNAGLSGTLQQALVHEYERSGAAWTLEWMILPQMARTTGAALLQAQQLLETIEFCTSD